MTKLSAKYDGITQELLKELFEYDPETGFFTKRLDHGLVSGWRRVGFSVGFPSYPIFEISHR